MDNHNDHHHHHDHDHGGHDMPTSTTSPALIIGGDNSSSSQGDHLHHHMSSGGHGMGHHMMMYFHGGADETILFEFWKISETGGLIISMIAIFLLAFGYEGLKFYREHLYRHSFQTVQLSTVAVPVENGTLRETHKTVQVGTTAVSNSPYNPTMNPIFLGCSSCECDRPAVASNCCTENEEKCNTEDNGNNDEESIIGDECTSKKKESKRCIPIQTAYKVKILSTMHCWQTMLHIVQMVISYFLMLIFMTYNVWLCLAVALGAGVGYFCFGWKKSVVVDVTEHCH